MNLRDLARYRFQGKNEQAIREEWIYSMLLLLGYGPTTLNEVKFGENLHGAIVRGRERVLAPRQGHGNERGA